MGQHLEEDTAFTLPTMQDPIQIPIQTPATHTVHRADTAMRAPTPKHSWQEGVTNILNHTK